MLVHSLGSSKAGFDDFKRFVEAMGGDPPDSDTAVLVGKRHGVELFLGWVTGEDEYLSVPDHPPGDVSPLV